MALQHLRSSTADKRPTPAAMSDGQLALNTNLVSPGLFFKDSNGDSVKIGPVHVGTTAPNVTPGAGGQAGNSKGEAWLDTTATNPILKVWNGSAFVAVQPVGTGTVVSTTDTGTVTSTMILDGTILNADINASAAIVDTKLATIATAGKVSNSATTATNANTASAIVARDASGNFTAGTITAALSGNASTVTTNANLTGDVTSVGNATSIASGVIVNADVNASAAIAGTKISPDFGSQTIITTGVISPALGTAALPSIAFTGDLNTGIFSPGADQVAVATNGVERLRLSSTGEFMFKGAGTTPGTDKAVSFNGSAPANSMVLDSSGRLGIGTSSPTSALEINGTITIGTGGTQTYQAGVIGFTDNNWGCLSRPPRAGAIGAYGFQSFAGTTRAVITDDGKVGIGTTSPGNRLHVSSSGDVLRLDSSSTDCGILLNDSVGGSRIGTRSASIIFDTGASERARIDSSGRLLVGTIASPAHQLQVSTDSAGKPSTNTWTIVSDERIKEEIELADLNLCYEAVKSIPLKRFKWKDEVYTEEQVRDRRKLGWIAQDVEAVFPKAVGTYEFKYNQVFEETIIPAVEEVLDDEGNVITPAQPERIEKGELISEDVIEDCRDLNSDQLYAAMYGAIQKLMVKVETLEIEVALLKAA